MAVLSCSERKYLENMYYKYKLNLFKSYYLAIVVEPCYENILNGNQIDYKYFDTYIDMMINKGKEMYDFSLANNPSDDELLLLKNDTPKYREAVVHYDGSVEHKIYYKDSIKAVGLNMVRQSLAIKTLFNDVDEELLKKYGVTKEYIRRLLKWNFSNSRELKDILKEHIALVMSSFDSFVTWFLK